MQNHGIFQLNCIDIFVCLKAIKTHKNSIKHNKTIKTHKNSIKHNKTIKTQ